MMGAILRGLPVALVLACALAGSAAAIGELSRSCR
jgi:hypothetical protein